MKIIIAFLVASLVFLVLKTFSLGVKLLTNRFSRLNFILNLMVAIEFIVWLGFIFWALDFLLQRKFYYQYLVYALILIVTGFVTWFLLRDIFSGIIFRVKHNLKNNSFIRSGDISGQIISQKITYMEIKTDDGQLLRIPYSRIIHEVISELAYTGALEEHIFQLQVDSSFDKTNAESLIRTTVLNTPWSNLKEEPSIKFLKENEKGYVFEIRLFSINMKQMKFIEKALEENPSLQVIS